MNDPVVVHPVDAWIDAIPEDPYAPCPCGCGMKWRFAIKDGIEKHEQRFMDIHNAEAHGRAVARTVQPLVGSLNQEEE